MTFSEKFLQLDGNFLIGIQHSLNADWFTAIMRAVSFLSEYGWLWIGLCLTLMAIKKTRRVGIICSASLLFAFIMCNGAVKLSVDRARPWEVIDGVMMLLKDPGDSSFPSGHANSAMATSLALWISTRRDSIAASKDVQAKLHKWSFVLLALAFLTGLSRVYLGMHFPSDVIAGWLIGGISAVIVYTIFIKLSKKSGTIDIRQ